jgi:hypothetical protein
VAWRRSWAVGALLLAPLAAGCSGSGGGAPEPTARPTPIAKLDVGTLRLARADFCGRVPDAAVRRALGGKAEADGRWGNGDPVATDEGSGDVGHEIGCAWTGAGGAAARAWVFARPVDASSADGIVRAAGRQADCSAEPTPVFGAPALLQNCKLAGGLVRARRAGLFGDTWLTCEVTAPAATPEKQRTSTLDSWCATVVAALTTSR